MSKLGFLLKHLIKFVRINAWKNLYVSERSSIGAFSRIWFSSESGGHYDQSIFIGKNAGTGRYCELHVWDHNRISIEDFAFMNDNCKIFGDVSIGRFCVLSSNIYASSGNHYATVKPEWLIRDQDDLVLSVEEGRKKHSKPIRIEEDCWIGIGVFVKQGLTIGRGAIIGSNAVVTADVKPYSINAGVPSRQISVRLPFDPPTFIQATRDDHLPYFYRGFDHRQRSLAVSRKKNGILVFKDCIVVLKGGNFRNLRISGRQRDSKGNNRMTVLWRNRRNEFEIKTEEFQIAMEVENGMPINDMPSVKALPTDANIIFLHLEGIVADQSWSINEVEIK